MCLVRPFVITYLSACVCFCVSLLLTYQLRVNTMFHSLLNPQALNQYIEGTQYVFIEKMNTKIAMWLNIVIRQEHFYTCKKKIRKKKPQRGLRGVLWTSKSIILLDVMDFAVGITYWNFSKYQMSTVLNEEETMSYWRCEIRI